MWRVGVTALAAQHESSAGGCGDDVLAKSGAAVLGEAVWRSMARGLSGTVSSLELSSRNIARFSTAGTGGEGLSSKQAGQRLEAQREQVQTEALPAGHIRMQTKY